MEPGDLIAIVYFAGWALFAVVVIISSLRGSWSGDDASLVALAGCGWPLLIIASPVMLFEWLQEKRQEQPAKGSR